MSKLTHKSIRTIYIQGLASDGELLEFSAEGLAVSADLFDMKLALRQSIGVMWMAVELTVERDVALIALTTRFVVT